MAINNSIAKCFCVLLRLIQTFVRFVLLDIHLIHQQDITLAADLSQYLISSLGSPLLSYSSLPRLKDRRVIQWRCNGKLHHRSPGERMSLQLNGGQLNQIPFENLMFLVGPCFFITIKALF